MSPDPVRDEAERLVAAAIAAVSVAARGLSGGGGRPNIATGTPECCVCPVCRVISAMRGPSPELSERLASGAADLAAGVTSLLRSFAARPAAGSPPDEGDEFWESLRRRAGADAGPDEDPWHAATTDADSTRPFGARATGSAGTGAPGRKPMAKKAMAKKAMAKKAVAKKAVAKKAVAKKTVAKKAVATKSVPIEDVAPKAVAKKAVAKKAVAKKAVKKATPGPGDG